MPNYSGNNKVKYCKLDKGRCETETQLEDLTGIGQKTLWLRRKKTRDYNKLSRASQKKNVNHTPRNPEKTVFEDTYKDLSPELFKLLFGKW